MHTALILTNSAQTENEFRRLLGETMSLTFRSSAGQDPMAAIRDIEPQLKAVDIALIDIASMGRVSKHFLAAIESISFSCAMAVRVNTEQQQSLEWPVDWAVIEDTDSPKRVKTTLEMLLERRNLQFHAQQLQQMVAQQQQLLGAARDWAVADRARGYVSVGQYREALKTLSRLFSQSRDVSTLADQFLGLLRELLGLNKLAIYLWPAESFLAQRALPHPSPQAVRFSGVAALGLSIDTVRALTLTSESGIGGYLVHEAKILRRGQLNDTPRAALDPHVHKEFEILSADVAVPIQDAEATLGILTFGGRITGEALTGEDLEFIFALCSTVATSVKNIWLADRVADQQQFTDEVLAHVQSGVVVINQQTQVVMANRRICELVGNSDADVRGKDISWLPSQIADLLFDTLRNGMSHVQKEVALQKSSRTLGVTTTRFTAGSLGAEVSDRLFAVGVVEDFTNLKKEERLGREAEHGRFMLQLATRLSHELRNSLVAVRTFAQLLPEKYRDDGFRKDFSATMEREIVRMDSTVGNINFLSQATDLDYQVASVSDVVETAIGRVCAEIWRAAGSQGDNGGVKPTSIVVPTGKTITIHRRFTHTNPSINADPKCLSEALVHVIRNAIQSMQDSEGKLTVSTEDIVESESSPRGVRIAVSDTGPGIPITDFQAIFEPFYTTRNVGVGLGLTIAKKIVEAHRGRIEVNSKLGKGSIISLLMPLSRDRDFSLNEAPGNGSKRTSRQMATSRLPRVSLGGRDVNA